MKNWTEWLKLREGAYEDQFGDNWNNGKGQAADIAARKNVNPLSTWSKDYEAQVAADKARTPRPTADIAAWNNKYDAQAAANKKQEDEYSQTTHNLAAGNYNDPATNDPNVPHHDTEYNDFGRVPDSQLNPQQLMQKNSRRRIIPGSPEWNKMDAYQKMTMHNSPANTMWQNQGITPAADRAKIYAQQGKTELQPWEQNPVPHPYMRKS